MVLKNNKIKNGVDFYQKFKSDDFEHIAETAYDPSVAQSALLFGQVEASIFSPSPPELRPANFQAVCSSDPACRGGCDVCCELPYNVKTGALIVVKFSSFFNTECINLVVLFVCA